MSESVMRLNKALETLAKWRQERHSPLLDLTHGRFVQVKAERVKALKMTIKCREREGGSVQ